MALIRKFQDGGDAMGNTILLFGLDYDANSIERQVYSQGLNDYIYSLHNGRKHANQIVDAVDKLWLAMKTGRASYNGSFFTDNKGEYLNANKQKKDYMGMAAYYLGNILDNAKPVEAPTPVEFSNTMFGEAVAHNIFGTDTNNIGLPSILAFMDLDLLDKETNLRPIDKRLAAIDAGVLHTYDNFDKLYAKNNWTKEQSDEYRQSLLDLHDALKDGTLDPGDAHLLNKVLGTFRNASGLQIGWQDLLLTDFTPQPTEEELRAAREAQALRQLLLDQNYEFVDRNGETYYIPKSDNFTSAYTKWLNKQFGEDPLDGKYLGISDITPDSFASGWNIIGPILDQRNQEQIMEAIKNYFYDNSSDTVKQLVADLGPKTGLRDKDAILYLLSYAAHKGYAEKIGDGLYAYTNVTNDDGNRVLVWNSKTGQILMVSMRKIPSINDSLAKRFREEMEAEGILFSKEGGTLEVKKFQGGGTPEGFLSSLSDIINSNEVWFDSEGKPHYETRWRNNLTDNGIVPQNRSEYGPAIDTINTGNKQYNIEPGGERTENQYWWPLWELALTNNEKLAEMWARSYANLAAKDMPHWNGWFENNDKDNGKFNFENFKKTMPNTNKNLWNDAFNGIGHDYYRGRFYATKDNNGRITSYGTSIPEGWEPETDWLEYNPLLDVQYLKQKAPETTATEPPVEPPAESPVEPSVGDTGEPVDIGTPATRATGEEGAQEGAKRVFKFHRNNQNPYLSGWQSIWLGLQNAGPAMFGAARLGTHIRGNRWTRDEILSTLHPALINPFEWYSPVTGEFGLMLAYNNQAADARRLANRNATSDASLNTAFAAEQGRHGDELEEKGLLADNSAIKESMKESLARREKSGENRTDVSNKNRLSINETNRERSKVKAAAKEKNITSATNYLAELQKGLYNRMENRRSLVNAARQENATMDYANAISNFNDKFDEWWKKENNSTIGPTLAQRNANSSYIQGISDLQNAYKLTNINDAFNQSLRYTPRVVTGYNDIIGRYKFAKKGAKLVAKSKY